MREYVLHEARSRAAYGQWSLVVRLVRNWKARRTARHLLSYNAYMLKDIGLTEHDLQTMLRQPLFADRDWEATREALIAAHTRR